MTDLENETSRELVTDIIGIFIRETGERLGDLHYVKPADKTGSLNPWLQKLMLIKSSAVTFGALHNSSRRRQRVVSNYLDDRAREAESIALIDSVEDIAAADIATLY